MRQVTHALLTRPPLSHFPSENFKRFVRLACVRHAASVHPEPGSNSHVQVCNPYSKFRLANFKPFYCCFRFLFWMFSFMAINQRPFYKNFQGFTYCSVFKELRCLADSSFTLSYSLLFVNNFFQKFFVSVAFALARTCVILPPVSTKVNTYFTDFSKLF